MELQLLLCAVIVSPPPSLLVSGPPFLSLSQHGMSWNQIGMCTWAASVLCDHMLACLGTGVLAEPNR